MITTIIWIKNVQKTRNTSIVKSTAFKTSTSNTNWNNQKYNMLGVMADQENEKEKKQKSTKKRKFIGRNI